MTFAGKIALLVFLIMVSAFFSASETAFMSLSNISVRRLVKEKRRGARRVFNMKQQLQQVLTTILVGNNLVNNFATAMATMLAVTLLGDSSVGVVAVAAAFFIILFGEIFPKTIALNKSEKIAFAVAPILSVVQVLFVPVVFLFSALTKDVHRFARKVWRDDVLVTEDELKLLIDVGNREGTLEMQEKEMLNRIFEFTDLKVKDIVRHRSLIKSVGVTASYAEVVEAFTKSRYSRLPVLDDASEKNVIGENFVGLLHYKDVLFAHRGYIPPKEAMSDRSFVRTVMKPLRFVPGSMPCDALLHIFKTERTNFAAVIDEHGGNLGIVTLDDILNAVFGHICDEYNVRDVPAAERIGILGQREFLVPGDINLADFNEIFGLHATSANFDTFSGWLLEQFDALPSNGETIQRENCTFEIADQSQRCIHTVRLKIGV